MAASVTMLVFILKWKAIMNFWKEVCDLSYILDSFSVEVQGQKPRAPWGGSFNDPDDGGFNEGSGCGDEM